MCRILCLLLSLTLHSGCAFKNPDTSILQGKRQTQADAQGFYTQLDGSKYKGQVHNGKPHGKGILQGAGFRYEGEFKHGEMTGQGRLDNTDGSYFVGQFQNGKLHGKGLSFNDYASAYGSWSNGKPDGEMSTRSGNNQLTISQYKSGQRHGESYQLNASGQSSLTNYSYGKDTSWSDDHNRAKRLVRQQQQQQLAQITRNIDQQIQTLEQEQQKVTGNASAMGQLSHYKELLGRRCHECRANNDGGYGGYCLTQWDTPQYPLCWQFVELGIIGQMFVNDRTSEQDLKEIERDSPSGKSTACYQPYYSKKGDWEYCLNRAMRKLESEGKSFSNSEYSDVVAIAKQAKSDQQKVDKINQERRQKKQEKKAMEAAKRAEQKRHYQAEVTAKQKQIAEQRKREAAERIAKREAMLEKQRQACRKIDVVKLNSCHCAHLLDIDTTGWKVCAQ
ncbi:hypothetical protein [Pseudoalteromonas luteoviolacea]|uniref:hypothetical protein n=1 Tax=Pseudoalteromonas luteoviolacea TaxID=43657 RepID=UPI0009B8160D|nr:hypothetical protein [Pseudoalteromonas luteoviolacea]